MAVHILCLVGGAPRVGKSSLAQRLLAIDGIPWLPADVVRTVVRRVAPDVDAIDQDPVDADALAEVMYPHIEQSAEVCAEEADCFLIEGFELALPTRRGCGQRSGRPRSARASLGTVLSLLRISPVTGGLSRSARANCHLRSCASPPAGSGTGADSYVSSARPWACRT